MTIEVRPASPENDLPRIAELITTYEPVTVD
jgi:hypothetical protein